MPILSYSINGENSGLVSAVNASVTYIQKLTGAVNDANVSLQFRNGIQALDQLSQKLLVINGNATLFGDTIKGQTQEIGAYQGALNSLLANGFDPLDSDVQRLKSRIDELNSAIAATPRTISVQGNQTPYDSIQTNATGSVGSSAFVTALNEQLAAGTITAQQYNEAILSANSATAAFGQSAQQASQQVEGADGYIQGLKQALVELNAQRLTAPIEDLALLNAEIQETEIALQQAGNVGKVGFDQIGNSIKGVSLTNVNGQLLALNNNLFGARQIAKDVVRTFDAGNLAGYAKGIGLLAVDFLYYAQNAQFAAGATKTATVAIEGEAAAATVGGISTAALGVAFSSLLTPVNLVILGVALIGGGLLAYEKSQKSATQSATEHLKALRAQKEALTDYLSTQSSSAQVEAQAAQNYAASQIKLTELVYAVQNNTGALFDGKTALQSLQDTFPAYFGNIDQAATKTDAFTTATKNANEALRAFGEFTAANNLAQKSIESADENQVAANTLLPALAKAQQALRTATKDANEASAGGASPEYIEGLTNAAVRAEDNVNALQAQIKTYNTAVAQANQQTQQFYDIANKNAPKAGTVETQNKTSNKSFTDPFAEIQDSINGIITKTAQLGAAEGLTGYAADVAKITKEYSDLSTSIEKVLTLIDKEVSAGRLTPTEGNTLTSLLKSGTSGADGNEDTALANAKIANAQKTANSIQAINDSFGVKSEQSRLKEIDGINKLADEKVSSANEGVLTLEQINQKYDAALATGNQSIIDDAYIIRDAEIQAATDASLKVIAIKTGQSFAIDSINEKYLAQEQDLYTKIGVINQQANDEEANNDNNQTARIDKTFSDRLIAVNTYFDKIRALTKTGNDAIDQFNLQFINAQQAGVVANLTTDKQQQIQLAISKPLIDGINQAASSFYSTLTSINQQTDQSFKAIFSDLVKSLNTSLNSVFLNVVEKGLTSALESAIKAGTSTLFNSSGTLTGTGAAIAGAGLAGGIISGSTSSTSTVGQGLGGALSGAATGAVIGSVVPGLGTVTGAVIGGAIGLIGGIFSASKAQKALQEQQLEQQTEQTALLKAQLAYTSSIIGRLTSNGVVTGINVGSTGQLVATVAGKDLQFVLSRVQNGR